MNHKTGIGVFVVVLVMLLGMAGYIFNGAANNHLKQGIVLSLNPTDIIRVDVALDTEKYSLEKTDDSWRIIDMGNNIDSDKLTILLTVASQIISEGIAEGQTLEETGLKEPNKSITFTLHDGIYHTLYVGDFDGENSFYYVNTEQGKPIYKMSIKTYQSLFLSLRDIIDRQVYKILAEDIKSITVSPDAKEKIIISRDPMLFNGIQFYWKMISPVEEFVVESVLSHELIPYITSMTPRDMISLSAQELQTYGLRTPRAYFSVQRTNGEEIKILLGKQENDTVYAKLNGVDSVFLLHISDIEFMSLVPNDLVDKRVMPFAADKLNKITLTHQGKTVSIDTLNGTINNEPADPVQYREALAQLSAMKYLQLWDKNLYGTVLYTIRYEKSNGKADVVELLAHEGDYLIVRLNGKQKYLMSETVMDGFWNQLNSIKTSNEG